MDSDRLSAHDTSQGGDLDAFWLRSWIAGEIGLAPYSFTESVKYDDFTERLQRRISRLPEEHKDFFYRLSRFSPLENEYCIKESCPSNNSPSTASPLLNGFTFLSTNRRVFYQTGAEIGCIELADIVKCELKIEGKVSTGMLVTTESDVTPVFMRFRMWTRLAESFLNEILKRSQVAKENSDIPALSAAINEYSSTGKLKKSKKGISGVGILIGIASGVFFFVTSAVKINSLGAALIIGAGAAYLAYTSAGLWGGRKQ
jgi:hypothetical protein